MQIILQEYLMKEKVLEEKSILKTNQIIALKYLKKTLKILSKIPIKIWWKHQVMKQKSKKILRRKPKRISLFLKFFQI